MAGQLSLFDEGYQQARDPFARAAHGDRLLAAARSQRVRAQVHGAPALQGARMLEGRAREERGDTGLPQGAAGGASAGLSSGAVAGAPAGLPSGTTCLGQTPSGLPQADPLLAERAA